MKKAILLNSSISKVIALLGHGDILAVADAGLPIPDGVERIDLAITKGFPNFIDTLNAVCSELYVERVVLASELQDTNLDFHTRIINGVRNLSKNQGNEIKIDYVSHEKFKAMNIHSKAVIRTGEYTPYANILLYSGVEF